MKYICFLLTMVLVLSLCGCGGEPAVSDPVSAITTTTTATQEQTTTTTADTTTTTTMKKATSTTTATTAPTTTTATTTTAPATTTTTTKKPTTTTPVDLDELVPGWLSISFTVEATSRNTEEDYTVEALERRFGIEIIEIDLMDPTYTWWQLPYYIYNEYDEQGNKTGRQYANIDVFIPEETVEGTLAIAKKVEEHPDVLWAELTCYTYPED